MRCPALVTCTPADFTAPDGQTGQPYLLGYGWTDNWASSLTADTPVPGDIYLLDGLRTDSDNGGPATSQPMMDQGQVVYSGGNVYVDDRQGDRVLMARSSLQVIKPGLPA